jgi:hypothetical protein
MKGYIMILSMTTLRIKRHFAEYHYAECRIRFIFMQNVYAKCRYGKCCGAM